MNPPPKKLPVIVDGVLHCVCRFGQRVASNIVRIRCARCGRVIEVIHSERNVIPCVVASEPKAQVTA